MPTPPNEPQFTLVQDEVPAAVAPAKGRVCPKCSYARSPMDTAPAWQCPRCGVAYDKAAAAATSARAAAAEVARSRRVTPAPAPPPATGSGKPVLIAIVVLALAGIGWGAYKWRQAHPGAAELALRAEAAARAGQVAVAQKALANDTALEKAEEDLRMQRLADGVATITRLADAGDLRAMVWLGRLNQQGLQGKDGLPKDHAKAMAWFRKAADEGEALAFVNLGYIYEVGDGEPQQMDQAANWYRKAARQGNASGLHALGVFYANGVPGVNKDPVLAYMLLELAQRDYRAAPGKDKDWLIPGRKSPFWASATTRALEPTMSPVEIVKAKEQADAWKPGMPLPE